MFGKQTLPPHELITLTKEQQGVAAEQPPAGPHARPVQRFGRLTGFVLVMIALVLCFSIPLYHLVQFAVTAEFHSYILLVPFVSLYLAWLERQSLSRHSESVRKLAVLPLTAGTMVLAGYWLAVHATSKLADGDSLALIALSFVLFFLGACFLFLGKETLQAIAFPIGFLVFMVPFPVFLHNWIVAFLQHGSAATAYGLFRLSGTPIFRYDMEFQLPGFSMEVAPECSGIQSSLVLFLTSLVAGHLFLRTPWKRAVLVLAVIPLGDSEEWVPDLYHRAALRAPWSRDDPFPHPPSGRPGILCLIPGAVLPVVDRPLEVGSGQGENQTQTPWSMTCESSPI